MNAQPDKISEVKKWIDKAEQDIAAAKYLMESSHIGLTEIASFHSQQCAEKYFKALLIFYDVHFPKTHDLRVLFQLVQKHCEFGLKLTDIIPLNRYVIEGRYPGDWEPISEEEALAAIKIASSVRDGIRLILQNEQNELFNNLS
jgi:HEPN domain-containing protein